MRISPGAYVVLNQTNVTFFLQKNYIKFLVKMFLPIDSIEKVMGLTPVKNSRVLSSLYSNDTPALQNIIYFVDEKQHFNISYK